MFGFRKKTRTMRDPEVALAETLTGDSERPLEHEEVGGVIECALRKLKESSEANRDSLRRCARELTGASTASIEHTRSRHSLLRIQHAQEDA